MTSLMKKFKKKKKFKLLLFEIRKSIFKVIFQYIYKFNLVGL